MTAKRPSPAARARRALLLDFALAALIAGVTLQLAAGLGVVAFLAVPLLLLGLLWVAVERVVGRIGRRRRAAAPD